MGQQVAQKTHMGSGARSMPGFQRKSRKGHLRMVKPQRGAGHHLEAATMGVTVAVEAARERGLLNVDDAKHLTRAERHHYVHLCEVEYGIVEWERGKSPADLKQAKRYDDQSQFDNVLNILGR